MDPMGKVSLGQFFRRFRKCGGIVCERLKMGEMIFVHHFWKVLPTQTSAVIIIVIGIVIVVIIIITIIIMIIGPSAEKNIPKYLSSLENLEKDKKQHGVSPIFPKNPRS